MDDELEWLDGAEHTTEFIYLWVSESTGRHYESAHAHDGVDKPVRCRTVTRKAGTVLGYHPELALDGEVPVQNGEIITTYVTLPPVYGPWVSEDS